MTALISSFLC